MRIVDEEWDEYKGKVDKIYDFLFEEGLEDRTGAEDLKLWRLVINRFSSARFFIGIIVGVLTVGIPAIWGVVQLINFIKTSFN